MFDKKILSLVSILLLGSLTTVKAGIAALPDCPNDFNPRECSTDYGEPGSNCVHGLNVYSITAGNDCRESVLTLTANTVNVINTYSEYPILADTGGPDIEHLVHMGVIALVDCGASSCSQTFGYFKSTETEPKYYVIGAGFHNSLIDKSFDEMPELLQTDGKLNYPLGNIKFGNNRNYLIYDDIRVFSENSGDVVVASRENSITKVNIGENSYLVTNGGSDLKGGSEVVDLVVKLSGSDIIVDTSFDGQDFCVDKNWAIYKREDGLCNADVDDEDCTHYYDCINGDSCTESLSNRNPRADCVPTASKKCAAGYYLVDGSTLSTNTGTLWECFSDDFCQDKGSAHPIGFLVNSGSAVATTKYIQCTGTTGSCTIASIGDECVEGTSAGKATYGQLYTENSGTSYQLCLYDGGKKSITIGASKKYLIEKKADNMLGFTQDSNEATKYVVLEVDASQNILPVASTAAGYYSTASATYEVVTEPENSVTLYSCAADTNGLQCGQVTSNKPIGYLKNQAGTGSATYIYCPKSGTCDAIAVTGTSCENTDATGSLHSTNKFCVYDSGDKSIELTTGANEGLYFVSAAMNLFELANKDDSFIVVKLDEQGNLTVVKESTPVRYRYTLASDAKNKIHTRAQAKAETEAGQICGSGGVKKEFIMIQWSSSDIDNDKKYVDYYIAKPTSE